MKNAVSFFNRKSDSRNFDSLAGFALNNQVMNLVRGGDGEPTQPGPANNPILDLWNDPEQN